MGGPTGSANGGLGAASLSSASSPAPTGIALGATTVVLTLLGWSSVPLFLKRFTDDIDLWTSNGWRYGFSALLWLPVVLVGLHRKTLSKPIWIAALVPGVVNSIGQVFFVWAHYKIDPAVLTFGLRTQMVFVAFGAYMLFPSERVVLRSRGFWVGIGLVVCGVIGTIVFAETRPSASEWTGIGMAILSGFFFAMYGLSVRWYMKGYGSVVSFAVISLYTAFVMLVLMAVFASPGEAYPFAGGAALDLSASLFFLLLLSAVVGIALGHVFYYISIARLGVAVSSGIIQLQPFLVGVGAYFFFGTVLTATQWISGLLAVVGAVVMLAAQRRVTRAARGVALATAMLAAEAQDIGPSPVPAGSELDTGTRDPA